MNGKDVALLIRLKVNGRFCYTSNPLPVNGTEDKGEFASFSQ
jgi:hypothetical protein